MNSMSSSIEFVLPSDSSFQFEINTLREKFESNFDLKISGTISKREIKGSVGVGKAEALLKIVRGDFYLKKSIGEKILQKERKGFRQGKIGFIFGEGPGPLLFLRP